MSQDYKTQYQKNQEKIENNEINTIEDVIEIVGTGILLADPGSVKMVMATVIGNELPLHSAWLMLIAPPSGGKTQILNPILGWNDTRVDENLGQKIFPVSDLTTNALATNMKGATSLLDRAKGGVIMNKDFTTVLSKVNAGEIMSQLREIYDGSYSKISGNDNDVNWEGKVCMIGACTEAIYEHEADMAVMGHRFVYLNLIMPDEMASTVKSIENHYYAETYEEQLKQAYGQYLHKITERLKDRPFVPQLPKEEVINTIAELSIFASKVRSGIVRDRKGNIQYAPTPERGPRIAGEIATLYDSLRVMRQAETNFQDKFYMDGNLKDEDYGLLYRVALSSAPLKRMYILKKIAGFKGGATISALAQALQYPEDSIREVISEMYSLKIVKRKATTINATEFWLLEPMYQRVMEKYLEVEQVNDVLATEGEVTEVFAEGEDDFGIL